MNRKIFITADLHHSHANIMKFCPTTRGHFNNVQDMNEWMVKEWNNIVGPEDLTYILGDVSFTQSQEAAQWVNRLNGDKILIEGNHDHRNLKDPVFRACFVAVHKYYELRHNGQFIVMGHYPFAEWNRMHHGSINFHGHLHGNSSGMEEFRSRDVAYDATGKVVWLLEDAIADALTGKIKSHH